MSHFIQNCFQMDDRLKYRPWNCKTSKRKGKNKTFVTLCSAELLAVIPKTRFLRGKRLFGKQSSFSFLSNFISNPPVLSLAPSQTSCRDLPFLSASRGTQGTSLSPSPHSFALLGASITQRPSLPGNQQALPAWESEQCLAQPSSEKLTPYCSRQNK